MAERRPEKRRKPAKRTALDTRARRDGRKSAPDTGRRHDTGVSSECGSDGAATPPGPVASGGTLCVGSAVGTPAHQAGGGARKGDPDAPLAAAQPAALPRLYLAFVDTNVMRRACRHWHYSKTTSTPPNVPLGVWEDDRFVGVVVFSRGAAPHIGDPYGLAQTEVVELTRVALDVHATPVTRIVAIAIKMLRRTSPGLRLIVSFADPVQGHHGGIYQGGNWIYVGQTAGAPRFVDKRGRVWHSRQVSASGLKKQYGVVRRVPSTKHLRRLDEPGKYKYLWPLDDAMRRQVAPLAKPYPKRTPPTTPESTP